MQRRMSIRLVPELEEAIKDIAKKRGLSANALISEMAWDFVDAWKKTNQQAIRRENET